MLEEFLRVRALRQQLDRAAQPCVGIRFAREHLGRRADAVLVERMRGDAVLGDLMHLVGAQLQLDALIAGPDDRGVDRAVVVLLGVGDVVLEPARHHAPAGVDDTERLVALRNRLHDHPEPEDIGQLLEADRLALHLAPHRVGRFAPPAHARRDPTVRQLLGQLLLDLADQVAVALGHRLEPLVDDLPGVRIEFPERKILELLAHLVHAHAGSERRVNVDRLLSDAAALLRRHVADGAHVVQPVGELDQAAPARRRQWQGGACAGSRLAWPHG